MSTIPLTEAHYAYPVKAARVTMHTAGKMFDTDKRSINHASIFLIIGTKQLARLNMTNEGPVGVMGLYKKQMCYYNNSESSLFNIGLRVIKNGLTVGDFVRLIEGKRRHEYMLAPTGVGCRFWVKTVIEDFTVAGYVDPSDAAKVYNGLQYKYSRNKEHQFEAIVPGIFVHRSLHKGL